MHDSRETNWARLDPSVETIKWDSLCIDQGIQQASTEDNVHLQRHRSSRLHGRREILYGRALDRPGSLPHPCRGSMSSPPAHAGPCRHGCRLLMGCRGLINLASTQRSFMRHEWGGPGCFAFWASGVPLRRQASERQSKRAGCDDVHASFRKCMRKPRGLCVHRCDMYYAQ